MDWKRKEPELKTGDYWFNGRCVATAGVASEIPLNELKEIARDVHETAFESGGVDYLQRYEHKETKQLIWVIDQVTKESLLDGSQPSEHNHFTIIFPHEY